MPGTETQSRALGTVPGALDTPTPHSVTACGLSLTEEQARHLCFQHGSSSENQRAGIGSGWRGSVVTASAHSPKGPWNSRCNWLIAVPTHKQALLRSVACSLSHFSPRTTSWAGYHFCFGVVTDPQRS